MPAPVTSRLYVLVPLHWARWFTTGPVVHLGGFLELLRPVLQFQPPHPSPNAALTDFDSPRKRISDSSGRWKFQLFIEQLDFRSRRHLPPVLLGLPFVRGRVVGQRWPSV